jgi:hypothetical protein
MAWQGSRAGWWSGKGSSFSGEPEAPGFTDFILDLLLRLEASTKKSIFSFLGNNAGYG